MSDPNPAAARRPVVLLVDDEQSLLDVMRLNLEPLFDIETVNTTEEAEMLMALRPVDVVVSDHLMPNGMGLEFLVRVSERYPQVRRILVTGYLNPELIGRATAVAGLSACLLKPLRYQELSAAISRSLSDAGAVPAS